MTAIIILITAAGIFAAGVAIGFILVVSVGIRREERRFARTGRVSLTRPSPGRVSEGARGLNGLYAGRQPSTVPLTARQPSTTTLN